MFIVELVTQLKLKRINIKRSSADGGTSVKSCVVSLVNNIGPGSRLSNSLWITSYTHVT